MPTHWMAGDCDASRSRPQRRCLETADETFDLLGPSPTVRRRPSIPRPSPQRPDLSRRSSATTGLDAFETGREDPAKDRAFLDRLADRCLPGFPAARFRPFLLVDAGSQPSQSERRLGLCAYGDVAADHMRTGRYLDPWDSGLPKSLRSSRTCGSHLRRDPLRRPVSRGSTIVLGDASTRITRWPDPTDGESGARPGRSRSRSPGEAPGRRGSHSR